MKIYVKSIQNGYVNETYGARSFFKDYNVEYIPSPTPDGKLRFHAQKESVDIEAVTLDDLRLISIKYNAHVIIEPCGTISFDFIS